MNINGASRMNSMPQNHNMSSMKQTTATKQQAMPENCGMKGMHEDGKGTKIDRRA